ncbi:MAG: hypothetical protein OEX81_02855 [Candidatus Pacebacteria bacterium]|nr:hypothetical protein [Candidatus Paceibacterota bacterium]
MPKQKSKKKKKPMITKARVVPDNFLRQLGQFKATGTQRNLRSTKIHMPRRPK